MGGMERDVDPPGFPEVESATRRLEGIVHRTPVLTSRTLDRMAGARLFFKCENFQRSGSFKFRGACNAVFSLGREEAARGVLTHSSGNHGQALALAARIRGIPAFVVMPENAPGIKREAVEGYGARVVFCAPSLEAREREASRLHEETGAVFIHPYEDPRVIAGQGTAALELLEEAGDLDYLAAPVGGGGLLAGTCLAARGRSPGTRVYGAEPEGADDAFRSLRDGCLHPSIEPRTVCDGLLTSLGRTPFAILKACCAGIRLVGDESILRARRLLGERMKILCEPSAAVPLAVALEAPFFPEGARVGIILSGGNTSLDAR